MVELKESDFQTMKMVKEAETLRKVAFFGVAFSTIATLVCVISLPMVYNYVQYVHVVLQNEMEFCLVSPIAVATKGGQL